MCMHNDVPEAVPIFNRVFIQVYCLLHFSQEIVYVHIRHVSSLPVKEASDREKNNYNYLRIVHIDQGSLM